MCEICKSLSTIIKALFGHEIPPTKIEKLIETSPLKKCPTQTETKIAPSIITTYLKQLNKIPTEEK